MARAISVRMSRAAATNLVKLLEPMRGVNASDPVDDGNGSGLSLDATLNTAAKAGATAKVRLIVRDADARLPLAAALAAIGEDLVIADAATEQPLTTIDAGTDSGDIDAELARLDAFG